MGGSGNCALNSGSRRGERAETAMADENKDNTGNLEVVNGMIGGKIDEEVA
jgi:hypothetical protein